MLILFVMALAVAPPPAKVDPCKESTTLDVNACLSQSLDRSKARLDKYKEAALRRCGDDNQSALRIGIQAAQDAFEAYRSIECAAVYENWKDGTIRGAMSLSCETRLTDARTHDIWQDWLQYMDSTPPVLPEPTPTR
jgi:uncharacterized protein YecT (DUF1311 family)